MLAELSYLWDGSCPNWVLLRAGEFLSPFDLDLQQAMILEDDMEESQVVEMMLKNNVRIVDAHSLKDLNRTSKGVNIHAL